jgi:choice-of-anchor B domain-containing protein
MLLIGLTATAVRGDHPQDCPTLPELSEFTVGDRVVIGERSFELRVVEEWVSRSTADESREEGARQGGLREGRLGLPQRRDGSLHGASLRLELLARPLTAGRSGPREGSYLPDLEVGIRAFDGGYELGSGTMKFHLSEFGPSYGTSLELDPAAASGDAELTFELALSEANDAPAQAPASGAEGAASDAAGTTDDDGGSHTGAKGECPELPLPDRLVVRYAPLGSTEPDQPGGSSSFDGENVRLTLLGSLDPHPAESYSDIWGYSDGNTYLAIIGHSNGTTFVDVTDPTNPTAVATIAGPNSSWRDFKTFGSYAYGVTEGSGAGTGMQVIDLTDPLNPTLVNTFTDTFTTAHNIYVDTNLGRAWVVGTDFGTRILDVASDPANPVEIGAWTTRYVHDAYVSDGLAYFAEINDGLHEILDVSDLGAISVLTSWATPDSAAHNSWANDSHTLVATTDEVTGGHVTLYDVTTVGADPPLRSEYVPNSSAIVHNVYFDDEDNDVLVMSHYGIGVHVVDAYRPTMPVLLGAYDTYPGGDTGFNGAWGVYAYDERGYIYASDIQTGLYVLRYDPTGGTVSGIVRDAASAQPVAQARVVLLSSGEEIVTGPDGVYAAYADAGDVQLRVSAPGFSSRILSAGLLNVGERLDADVSLQPLPTGPLAGVVRRSDNLAGIDGARVAIPSLGLSQVSAADGSFDFGAVAIGGHMLTAEAFGFSSAELRVAQTTAGFDGVILELSPGAFVDDVESDQGWTLGLPQDGAGRAGEWERVDPVGTGGGAVQPEDDASPDPGVTAFITGQANQSSSVEQTDVDGGNTTLESPVVDGSGLGAAKLGYSRWLSTDAGTLSPGGTLLVEISDDGGSSWTQLESTSASAPEWRRLEFDLGSFVSLSTQMQLRIQAISNGSFDDLRVLEAGIDDVEVVAACRRRFNPAAGDRDFDGDVDACDACPDDAGNDSDGDGACGDADNAPFSSNADQLDADADGVGDVADNCVDAANSQQWDSDADGLGNACDDDIDGDGLDNAVDEDRDGDGEPDGTDVCADVPDPTQADEDADGVGDACDPDDGRVFRLRLAGSTISWPAEQGVDGYDLYRGDLGAPALLPLARCIARDLTTSFHVDEQLPTPGDAYFYLATTVSGGVEGSLGRGSDGAPRSVEIVCQ